MNCQCQQSRDPITRCDEKSADRRQVCCPADGKKELPFPVLLETLIEPFFWRTR
jgi:uncharacterized protein YceK